VSATRPEKDSFGTIEVPAERLWGAQTERSRRHFRISGERMPLAVVHALALVKRSAARVNGALGLLEAKKAEAVEFAHKETQFRNEQARLQKEHADLAARVESMKAQDLKIEVVRRLIDRYYEGHPAERKQQALEELAQITGRD